MTPASAPATNVSYMLGQLMDRTECLPELRDDVSTLKADFRHMRDDFDAHSKATDEELRRIRLGSVTTRVSFARLRGKWQGAVIVLLMIKEAAMYLWPQGRH